MLSNFFYIGSGAFTRITKSKLLVETESAIFPLFPLDSAPLMSLFQ